MISVCQSSLVSLLVWTKYYLAGLYHKEMSLSCSTDLDGVLAHSECVPQLDSLVPGARHNLPVVSAEGNTQDILGVSNEAAGGLTTANT